MSLTRADFDNPEVDNATNPSNFGYHHGPIPNNNPGWLPDRQQQAKDNNLRPPPVTAAENATAPSPAVSLSTMNGLICDIAVNGNQMCGMVFSGQPAFRRHVRSSHPGATVNPARANTPQEETIAGENALKKWVRDLGWRNARYLNEPGRGSIREKIDRFATSLEEIAANDHEFAERFGTKFHRAHFQGGPGTPSSGKRKRGPSPPPPTASSPETPTRPPRKTRARKSAPQGHRRSARNTQQEAADIV